MTAPARFIYDDPAICAHCGLPVVLKHLFTEGRWVLVDCATREPHACVPRSKPRDERRGDSALVGSHEGDQ